MGLSKLVFKQFLHSRTKLKQKDDTLQLKFQLQSLEQEAEKLYVEDIGNVIFCV